MRSSTPTRATSSSRSPRTSCSSSRWASSPSASASACGCSSVAIPLERFVSCLVFLPRDRFNTRNRERIQQILAEAFDAESVDFELRLSESVLVRIHFTVRLRPGTLPAYDPAEIEARIVEATGSWTDELREALLEEAGEEQGTALYRRYGDAFPAGYRDDWVARSAVVDIRRIEQLAEGEPLAVSLYHPLEAAARSLRCKLYRRGEPLTLSDVLPMFESMGLRVRDERPYEVTPSDAADVDLRLRRRVRRRRRARRRRGARALPGRVHRASGAATSRATASTRSCCGRGSTGATSRSCGRSRATCGRRASPSASATWSRRCSPIPTSRPRWWSCSARASTRTATARRRPRTRSRAGSRRRSTPSTASTRTASCAASSPSCARCCGPTTSSPARTARPSRTCRSSSIPSGCRCCPLRARASRSSSTRRASRACTCAAAPSPAAACAGPIAARTSGPRSSA